MNTSMTAGVPEFFLVSNWTDASYTAVRPQGVRATRETYATLNGLGDRSTQHGEPGCRLAVQAALHDSPLMFRFNNGDPFLFNPIANAILDSFVNLSSRGQLKDPTSVLAHLSIVRAPVEAVSKLTFRVCRFERSGHWRKATRPGGQSWRCV